MIMKCSMVVAAAAAASSLFNVVNVVHAAPLNDLITELPDWGRPPTPHFSGYLDASKGCDTEINGPVCKIHYWLALAAAADDDADTADTDTTAAPTRKTAPTVLWLNGGPGSSSLLGWLQEVGPLLMNATGGLMENPWSWTTAGGGVNLLAIEAPMGVGFSYCSRQLEDNKPCQNTDTSTANASRAALVDFFANKFPELADGEFYIAGESYAGVYIPTLAKELLTNKEANRVVPLTGILVGDPCTDNAAQRDSMDSLWYSNKYGLMDSDIYQVLQQDECKEYKTKVTISKMMMTKNSKNTTTDFAAAAAAAGTHSSKSHQSIGKKWSNAVTAADLNQELLQIEDLAERRLKAESLYHERVLGIVKKKNTNNMNSNSNSNSNSNNKDNSNIEEEVGDNHPHLRVVSTTAATIDGTSFSTEDDNNNDNNKCKLAYRKFLMSSSNALSQGWKDMYIDDYSLFAPITSKEDEQMAAYFNRKDVRQALHVTDTPFDMPWPSPECGFDYTKEYNVCNWQPREDIKFPDTTMVDIYQEIVPLLAAGGKTWIYNGDTDPCVSYEGTREAVKQILINELDGGSYRPWFYRQEAASLEVLAEKSILFGPGLVAQQLEEAQFGGEITSYEQGLSFVTFHGSGHMVPQFRPQASLHFLSQFILSSSSSPSSSSSSSSTTSKVGEELSPLLPTNATLVELSEDDFETAMDDWTETAKAMAGSITTSTTTSKSKGKSKTKDNGE